MTLRKKPFFSSKFALLAARSLVLMICASTWTLGIGCRSFDERLPFSYSPSPVPERKTPSTFENAPNSATSKNRNLENAPGFLDDSSLYRGQNASSGFLESPADSPLDAPTAGPPAASELPQFIVDGGANVPDPTGNLNGASSETDERRESIADREKAERDLEERYAAWIENQKRKQKSLEKTPRYLQPLTDHREIFDDPASPFARQERENSFIRQVTAADLSLMTESGPTRELYDWEKDVPTPVDWSKYALTVDRVRGWLGMGPDEAAALEYMRQACEKHKEYYSKKEPKLLKEAAVLYERAAKRWPGPALNPRSDLANAKNERSEFGVLIEEDGLFFAGECWFFYRDFNRALVCFKALVSTYSSSIYKEVAMRRLYYIGCYWSECSEESATPSINVSERDKPTFSSFSGAQKAFETIFLNDASDSGLAPAALYALANAYMRRGVNQGDGAFESAARYYKQLYEFYPGSKYAEDACRLAMIALHKSYQGPFYDATPLDEASELAEVARRAGRGNMQVVEEELEKIKEEQANHLFVLGQYYEKRGHFASARSYYNRLVREHPNSVYASEAARAYENIASQPAEADQFAWIRPVAPFMPKPSDEYFEEEPDADLSQIAKRDESLDEIGRRVPLDGVAPLEDAPKRAERENVATAPDESPQRR